MINGRQLMHLIRNNSKLIQNFQNEGVADLKVHSKKLNELNTKIILSNMKKSGT